MTRAREAISLAKPMRSLITIATILSLGAASAQIRWEKLSVVADSDPAAPALKEWQQGVEAEYKKDGLIIPTFSSWFELPFDSLKTLFPDHRFFATSWSEMHAPGKEKEVMGLAAGLETTLVCDAKGKLVKEVHHTGNYEAFGELLNSEKVVIRTADDAKLVWEAFCDIHQRHWKDQPAIKIDDRKWHLGDKTIDRFHYYYEVLLDADLRVTGARLCADEIRKP
jgi:hypothetical protein